VRAVPAHGLASEQSGACGLSRSQGAPGPRSGRARFRTKRGLRIVTIVGRPGVGGGTTVAGANCGATPHPNLPNPPRKRGGNQKLRYGRNATIPPNEPKFSRKPFRFNMLHDHFWLFWYPPAEPDRDLRGRPRSSSRPAIRPRRTKPSPTRLPNKAGPADRPHRRAPRALDRDRAPLPNKAGHAGYPNCRAPRALGRGQGPRS
jgi:hypothetical protein